MKGKQQQDFRVEKYIRYGIRKYSFGAASVAIAAGLMFLGNGAVSASETAVNGNGSDVAVVSANTEDNQDKVVTPVVDNKEVKEEAKPEAVTPKVEESKKEEVQKTEEVTKEEAAPKLDKSQLESYVNEVAGKLASGKYANKTDESLALLNADLEAAKTALSNATSQDELKAAYNKLVTTVNSKLKNKPVEKKETPAVDTTNGKETVGKKAENTEKKSDSNAIENTGSKDERNGKELVEGSNLRSANEGYTLASTELRKENGEFATATGKTYKELDSNAAYRIYVKGFQSENTEEVAKNNPQPGTGARTDLPLSKTEAQKLGREAAMWNNKLRASGQNNNTNPYGSGGAYEYLATEIYGYTYEQGNHYVYLKDVTKRFELNDAAKTAGYTIKKVTPMNLPPGLGYNANSDTVEGYIGANIQNGVYDFRYELTVAKGDTEQKVYFRDLQAGWIGWQDSTAPRIQGVSTMVTIGEDVSHSLQYVDNDGVNRDTRANYQREDGSKFVAGSKTAPSSTAKKAEFVAADGTTVKSMNNPQTVTAYTTLNGKTLGKNGEKPVSLDDTIPGLTYAPETGLITGKPTEAGIFTVAAMAKDYNSASAWNMNGDTEQKVYFRDLQAGWIGWQDSTAPRIQGVSTMVTIGEDVSHSLQYVDNDGVNRDTRANYQREDGSKFVAGSKTAPSSTAKKAEFVAADGTTVKSMNNPQTVTAYTTLNGKTLGKNGEKPVSLDDTIPGLTYAPETGLITGKPTEAGIFTVAAMAKDYNSASAWNMNGQEAHENITIAVAPKITVKNVEAYATSVPVTISNGANKAEITMPDGTVTKLVAKDGNWTVAAGTTNTAVQEGAVLGAVAASGESTINLTVTPESTKYVGVDSIAAKATTDKVQAHLQRETITVKDHNNKEYTATFNRATGKYTLPNEDAYQLEESGDNSILTERRVYTEAQANGDVKLFVYEFTRTWNAKSTATSLADKIAEIRTNGEVTAVGDVFRTETLLPNDQTSSTQGRTIKVSYDSASDQWSASDGSTVTATKSNAGWKVSTTSGFSGYIAYREAVGTDLASIQNDKPTGTSTSYSETKGTSVDLIKSTKANVAFTDTIDDKTSATDSDTIKTKVTATAPDGTVTTFDGAQAEETAYIQAQRTAAAKTQAAATAVKEQQDAQNDLASLQERLDRQTRAVEDAQVALDNLKLRTISPTAQQMAQKTLEIAKEIKAKLEADIEAAKGTVATRDTAVNASRQEALEAEKAVETAREALKTAAEANLAKANAYVLSQKGRYKVTARAVDSNGVVTTPTVDGTDAGEVTEDAVAETTYYIVVTEPEKSSGAQGQKQTDSMADNFNDGKEGTTVSNYKLVDPKTGAKVESVTTEEGTYTVDPTTGEVTFTPVEGFVGTANPVTVAADVTFNDESGNPVTVAVENAYTPTVYGIAPSADETTGKQGQTQTSISGKDRFSELNNTDNTLDGTNVDWTTAAYSLEGANAEGKVVVDGEGTYSIDPTTGVVTFEPLPTFTGKAKGVNVQVSVTATDSEGNKVPVTSKGSYTPKVTPVTPTGEGVTSSGKQGQEQTGTPKFTQGDETAPITINEQQPAKFVVNGQPVEDKEIPATKDGKEVGKYVIDPLTGVVTFKPNKDFIGTPDPATVEVKDKNGTPATATYTPTVTPVVPTAEPKETSGKQGQPQTQETESMFKQGDEVAPIDKTTVKLVDPSGNEVTTMPALKDGKEVGTYTIDPTTGVITFQPNKDFTGTPDPAKVVAKDTNGTKVETTYTPTVTPVTPTADPAETTDIQGKTQTGKPTFTPGADEVPMNDEVPATFEDGSTEKVIPGEGTYTVAPDGTVTFTPEKTFTGKGTGVTVKRVDKNGTPVTAKYTPNVTPVTPTADPAETTDIQGKEQNGKPTFTPGNPEVPMDDEVPATFEDGSTTKTIPEEGTYTVAPDGTVTFTPEKTFTGVGTGVTVKRVDKNGTPVTAKYTPTVTPVTPEGTPAETTDIQGKEQTGKPTFTPGNPEVPMDDEVPATFEDGSTTKTIPGEGTYTVAPDGTVTFTPEKTFTGVGTGVTVKRVDKNGTPVTAKYTPTVTPVTPEGTPAETTDIQGKEQNGKPTFTPGNPDVPMDDEVPATFEDGSTTKTIPGEGTYTVAPDGTVTFTPEKTFTGVGTGVTVKRVDKNGTPVTAKYTPTVTPVTPVGTPAESEGPKGQQQTGTPVFTPGNPNVPIDEDVPPTFEDGTTTKVVPGEGTYTIDKDGKVTFTPEKDFVGKAKGVTVKRVDKNGTPVTATYTPTVRPDTSFVDKDGNPLSPTEDGTKPTKDIPGYKIVKTEVDEKGNTKHIYEKVTTTYKDKDGNVIPGTTTEEGTTPKKDIPGYRFVETKTLPNGDTEHIYEKVKTSFKDKDGNEIPGYPTEDGDQPKKDIPGYRFVETKKLPNGDVEHVYEKVSTPLIPQTEPGKQNTTTWTDENGNPLKPTEPGSKEPGTIPGYEYVKTVTDPNGNIRHIFRKVEMPTPRPVEPSQPVQPVSPQEPTSPEKPVTPDMPAVPEQPKQPATPKYVEGQKELPNTGTEDNARLAALGLLGVLSGFGLVARKKKED